MNGNFLCAIRGPMLLITLGVLLAIDQLGHAELRAHLAGAADRVRPVQAGRARRGSQPHETNCMRRSSIVAPLLLIGIGALFLARNMYPELPLLDYLAKYWPFLLIAVGRAAAGARSCSGRRRTKPLPARGVSGGEWVLVVFLCMFGASLHTVRGFSTWWPRSGITMGGLDMFGESLRVSDRRPRSRPRRRRAW